MVCEPIYVAETARRAQVLMHLILGFLWVPSRSVGWLGSNLERCLGDNQNETRTSIVSVK